MIASFGSIGRKKNLLRILHKLPMAAVVRRPPSERRRSAPSRAIEEGGMDLLDDDDDEPEAPRGSASASASGEVAEKKQRFVWTPDLHCRFEAAVQAEV